MIDPEQFPNLKKFKYHYIFDEKDSIKNSTDKGHLIKLLPFLNSPISFKIFEELKTHSKELKQKKYLDFYELKEKLTITNWLNSLRFYINEESKNMNLNDKKEFCSLNTTH